jgi:hypothetical protein
MGTRLGTVLGTALGTALGTEMFGAPCVWGLGNWDATNFYRTALGAGDDGVLNTGWGQAVLYRVDALNGAFRIPFARFSATSSPQEGYECPRIISNAVNATCYYGGGGAFAQTATYTYQASDVGKWDLLIWQHTGTHLRCYRAGAQLGADVAAANFNVMTNVTRTVLGYRGDSPGTGASTAILVAGSVQWRGIPAAQDVANFYAAVKTARNVVAMPGVTMTHGWNPAVNDGATAPATLADMFGTDDMARNGTPTLVADNAPSFMW